MNVNSSVHCSVSPFNPVTRPNAGLLHGVSSFCPARSLSLSASSSIFFPITHQRKRQRIRVLVLRASFSPVALDEGKDGHGSTASTGQKSKPAEFLKQELPSSGTEDRVWWSPNDNEEGYSVPARYMKRLPWEVEQGSPRTRAPKSSDNSTSTFAQEQHDSLPHRYQGKGQQDGPPRSPQKLQGRAPQRLPDFRQDRASWSARKQQDRASWAPRKQQNRGSWSPDNQEDRESLPSQKHWHSRDSFSFQSQQTPFQKYGGSNMQPKSSHRLQNRSSVFRQVVQSDRFDTFSRIGSRTLADQDQDEDDTFPVDSSYSGGLGKPGQGLMEGGSLGKGDPRDRSLSTSKLEEILSRFMPKHLSSKGHNGGGKRNIVEANRMEASEAKTAWRSDVEGSREADYVSRSINTPPDEDPNSDSVKDDGRCLSVEDCTDDPSRDRTSAFGGKKNDHGLESAPGTMFTSSSLAPGEAYTGRKVRTLYQNKNVNGAFIGASSRPPSTHAPPTRSSSGTRRSSLFIRDSRSRRGKYYDQQSMEGEVQHSRAEKIENPGFEWTDSESEDDVDHDARNAFSIASGAETDSDDDAGDALSITSGVEGKADTYSTSIPDSGHSDQPALGGPMTRTTKVPSRKKVPSWHSHSIPGLPFEFQFSYSETPAAPIVRFRERPFSPFGPDTMERPWTGRAPLKPSKKKVPEFDSFKPPPRKKGIKYVQDPGPFREGQYPKPAKSREEILGEPLTSEEIALLVDKCQNENRQLNLGRDGLTHNMLDLVHCHWKRRRVIKIRCLGVPTIDMDNVCFHLEDKTGGKIIYRTGGVVYLFRGRYYNYKDRPRIPIMLWKPATPVYPKLIQPAPGGLTKEEADRFREIGKKIEPMCSLVKNGVYLTLVNDIRDAFKVDPLVRIDCRGLNPSDYKKIGGKLKDLVPCVLLSFDDEQILIWKGQEKGANDGTPPEGLEAEGSESEAVDPSDFSDGKCLAADIMQDAHGDDGESSEASSHYSGDIGAEYPEHMLASISWSSDEAVEVVPGDAVTHTGVDFAAINATNNAGTEEGYELNENSREEDIALHSPSSELDGEVEGATVLGDVDALWDDAITSGIAVELEVHADSDLVARKAEELAQAVPSTHVYSLKLLNKLQIRKARRPKQERELDKELYKLHDLRRRKKEKKMLGRFRLPSVGASQSGGGLPVDELARLLSVK